MQISINEARTAYLHLIKTASGYVYAEARQMQDFLRDPHLKYRSTETVKSQFRERTDKIIKQMNLCKDAKTIIMSEHYQYEELVLLTRKFGHSRRIISNSVQVLDDIPQTTQTFGQFNIPVIGRPKPNTFFQFTDILHAHFVDLANHHMEICSEADGLY